MEKNINLIVKEDENNLRLDVLINKREGLISRTRIKNLILKEKLITLKKVNCRCMKLKNNLIILLNNIILSVKTSLILERKHE